MLVLKSRECEAEAATKCTLCTKFGQGAVLRRPKCVGARIVASARRQAFVSARSRVGGFCGSGCFWMLLA